MSTATPTRLVELYREGGLAEVQRGVVDFAYDRGLVPLHLIKRTGAITVGDVSIRIGLADREAVMRTNGFGELPALERWVDTIEATDVVWDIGANVGVHSLLAASLDALVYAFEPGFEASRQLRRNTSLNDVASVYPVHAAVSDRTGIDTLTMAERTGTRSLGGVGEPVPVLSGGDLPFPDPTVVKVDVEGHEAHVLKGIAGRLGDARAIFVEVHQGVSVQRIERQLADAGLGAEEIETPHPHTHLVATP